MRKRVYFSLIALSVILSGCSAQSGKSEDITAAVKTETTGEEQQSGKSNFAYPMSKGDKLTYWCELNGNVSPNFTNLGDTPFGKALMEETGVEVGFLHPPAGQLKEQFSLILADGKLPDLMEYTWVSEYPGGPEKAIKDGVIIPLNEVFDKYCPNIKAYLKENPEVDKMIKTDEGNYYAFPFIRGDEKLCNTIGLMLRSDWLKELNLEVPTTIDEWHTVLTAFKDKKGAVAPYCPEYTQETFRDNDPFAYAYKTTRSFYVADDGTIRFGAIEPAYKEYLKTMQQWYKEGLIDPDMATLKGDQVTAKMTSGQAGASLGWPGSKMGVWINAATAKDANYMLVPAPYPTLNKGEKPEFGQIDNRYPGTGCVAITTACKDVERAARFLDYGYSEAGHMLFNFGVEGKSYTMMKDYPTYSDWVMKNPDGWPVAQSMSAYIRGNYQGPFVQDIRYLEQYYMLDSQKQTPDVWGNTNAKAHKIPPITPTADESKEYSAIMNEINTYRDEMILKFILGTESLDNFDNYVKNIEGMGLNRALEIENAALVRYKAR